MKQEEIKFNSYLFRKRNHALAENNEKQGSE